jgi:hypothetical protein
MVFLTPGQAEVNGQLYDQRSQELSPIAKDSSPEGLVTKLMRFIDAEGYVAKPALEPEKTEEPSAAPAGTKKIPDQLKPEAEGTFSGEAQAAPQTAPVSGGASWYKNPWIWAAIGGGLLLVGGGVFVVAKYGKQSASTGTVKVVVP